MDHSNMYLRLGNVLVIYRMVACVEFISLSLSLSLSLSSLPSVASPWTSEALTNSHSSILYLLVVGQGFLVLTCFTMQRC